MKNWRTTLVAFAGAVLAWIELYQRSGGDLTKWQQWLLPALIAGFGYLAKDAGVSGPLKLALLSCFLLPSCATNGAGQTTFLSLTKADWTIIGKDAAVTGAKAAASSAFLSYGERRAVGPFTATK